MSRRQRSNKSNIYYGSSRYSSNTSSSSTIDTIRELCDTTNTTTTSVSSVTSATTIDAIREVCNDFNFRVETNTSPTTIDAIREICNNFTVRGDPRNAPATIDAIRGICNNKPVKKSTNSHPNNDNNDNNFNGSTADDIRELCGGNNSFIKHNIKIEDQGGRNRLTSVYDNKKNNGHCDCTKISYTVREDCHRPSERYDPGVSYFNSVITPVNGLTPHHSGVTGSVQFRMRRKNKTVTLQWEPFSGSMAASGVAFLTVAQSIWNTPPYPISIPIYMKYKDVNKITNITIDPHSTSGNIKFYLNSDGNGNGINTNDAFYIYAGAVSWIVD